MGGLGQAGRSLEELLAALPATPELAAEVVARLGGGAAARMYPQRSQGAENRLRGILAGPRFGARGLRLGRGVTIDGPENVRLGDKVSLAGGVFLSATGDQGRISIGEVTHVDRGSVLYGQGGLEIGARCAIAAHVVIYSQTNRFDLAPHGEILEQGTRYAPVKVGDDVWIGAGAILIPGITVGDHAVIAAGAVITKDVPAWHVAGGVPAKVLKDRREM